MRYRDTKAQYEDEKCLLKMPTKKFLILCLLFSKQSMIFLVKVFFWLITQLVQPIKLNCFFTTVRASVYFQICRIHLNSVLF